MAEKKNNAAPQGEENLSQLLQIRRDKLKQLQESGNDPFQITKYEVDNDSANIKENFDALEGQKVSLAGRLMSKRGMGKVSFCDLQDKSGRIQLYARKDEMDEEEYNRFKKYDIGDIVGVKGEVFRTQRGEMSVRVDKVTLLSKSLLPLPEKFHGLTNTELRYRQRYVDLIANPEVKRNFIIRSQFIKHVRDFMDARGFMEVETPVLNTISGGATARPFITHHNTLDIDMYMRIATELPLKRLIVGGMDRVYEIGRIFRNEGMDPQAQPRVHHHRALPGLCRLQRHDGPVRGPAVLRRPEDPGHLSGGVAGGEDRPDPRLAPYAHARGRKEVLRHRLYGYHLRRGGRGCRQVHRRGAA